MSAPTNCLKCELAKVSYPLAAITGKKEAKRVRCFHEDSPDHNWSLVRVRTRNVSPPGWCPLRKEVLA